MHVWDFNLTLCDTMYACMRRAAGEFDFFENITFFQIQIDVS